MLPVTDELKNGKMKLNTRPKKLSGAPNAASNTNATITLVMLPSSVMILTGIWGNLYQEIEAVKNYDAYQPFI